MGAPMIDLRSDTVTQPTAEMRAVMAAAPVGDDVIYIDPTVRKLEEKIADLLGKEAAMYMPSGTMTNQVAVRLHCSPGDELICEEGCHIYNYEQGAVAQLSGVATRTVVGQRSVMDLAELEGHVRPENEHNARTRLVCIENTANRGGGVIIPIDSVEKICGWAKKHSLATHLDGARLMNAVVESGISAKRWAVGFDTVSVCFSKGLGAPVGSALVCSRDMLPTMRRHRKLFGGAMRQSGIIAAGALYALENNIDRLADDHRNARLVGEVIDQSAQLQLEPETIDTNIVIFRLAWPGADAAAFCRAAKEQGVWMLPFSKVHVRAVTHLHITENDARMSGQIIAEVADQLTGNATASSGISR